MFKTHQSRSVLICVIVTLTIAVGFIFGLFDKSELKSIDWRFMRRGNRPVDSRIAMVLIDDGAIHELGRWPWPRKYHGELIRALNKAGAKAIAFDMFFPEPDLTNPASDQILAEAAKEAGNVVSAFPFEKGIS